MIISQIHDNWWIFFMMTDSFLRNMKLKIRSFHNLLEIILVSITRLITRLIVINIAPLMKLFGNYPLVDL